MDKMTEWFTVTDASNNTGIPPETIRRYIRKYGSYLYTRRGEKRAYQVHRSSLDTLEKIRYLLENDYNQDQIHEILQQTEQVIVQADDEQMQKYLMNLPELHRETEKHIRQLSEQLDQQNELMQNMAEQLKEQREQTRQQQEYINQSLHERDQKLMNTMNELIESRKEEQDQKKRGFFARLFNL